MATGYRLASGPISKEPARTLQQCSNAPGIAQAAAVRPRRQGPNRCGFGAEVVVSAFAPRAIADHGATVDQERGERGEHEPRAEDDQKHSLTRAKDSRTRGTPTS